MDKTVIFYSCFSLYNLHSCNSKKPGKGLRKKQDPYFFPAQKSKNRFCTTKNWTWILAQSPFVFFGWLYLTIFDSDRSHTRNQERVGRKTDSLPQTREIVPNANGFALVVHVFFWTWILESDFFTNRTLDLFLQQSGWDFPLLEKKDRGCSDYIERRIEWSKIPIQWYVNTIWLYRGHV